MPGPIAPADAFGPWAPDILPAERLARLRCLRTLVHVLCGPRGRDLADLLHRAEGDADSLAPALDALARLEPTDRRHVLASYARLHRPPERPASSPGDPADDDRTRQVDRPHDR